MLNKKYIPLTQCGTSLFNPSVAPGLEAVKKVAFEARDVRRNISELVPRPVHVTDQLGVCFALIAVLLEFCLADILH